MYAFTFYLQEILGETDMSKLVCFVSKMVSGFSVFLCLDSEQKIERENLPFFLYGEPSSVFFDVDLDGF